MVELDKEFDTNMVKGSTELDVLNLVEDQTTGLTEVKTQKITYPFLYVEDVSTTEMEYLKNILPKGDVPLYVMVDSSFGFICNTELSLTVIKRLSQFKEREIYLKQSKKDISTTKDLLPLMLLN